MNSWRDRRAADAKTRYSTIENVMLRTFSPKHCNYFGDGGGRDTYVVTDCGGLMGREKVGMTRRPFKNTPFNRDAYNAPLKHVMPVNYHSDGTGRDTYVINNSGGLAHDFHGSTRSDVNFLAGLRVQQARVMPNTHDSADITNFVGWRDPRTRRTFVENAKKIDQVTKRLSPSPHDRRSPQDRKSPQDRRERDNLTPLFNTPAVSFPTLLLTSFWVQKVRNMERDLLNRTE